MKTYMKGNNAPALTHVDIPDENRVWRWMQPLWKKKLHMTVEKTVVLSCFLTLEACNEIVDRVGIYSPHK
eukprot:4121987-Ditylum_brightwellii.AAC.1